MSDDTHVTKGDFREFTTGVWKRLDEQAAILKGCSEAIAVQNQRCINHVTMLREHDVVLNGRPGNGASPGLAAEVGENSHFRLCFMRRLVFFGRYLIAPVIVAIVLGALALAF